MSVLFSVESKLWTHLIFPRCVVKDPLCLLRLRACCRGFLRQLNDAPISLWFPFTQTLHALTMHERRLGWEGVVRGRKREQRTRQNVDCDTRNVRVKADEVYVVGGRIFAYQEDTIEVRDLSKGALIATLENVDARAFDRTRRVVKVVADRWLVDGTYTCKVIDAETLTVQVLPCSWIDDVFVCNNYFAVQGRHSYARFYHVSNEGVVSLSAELSTHGPKQKLVVGLVEGGLHYVVLCDARRVEVRQVSPNERVSVRTFRTDISCQVDGFCWATFGHLERSCTVYRNNVAFGDYKHHSFDTIVAFIRDDGRPTRACCGRILVACTGDARYAVRVYHSNLNMAIDTSGSVLFLLEGEVVSTTLGSCKSKKLWSTRRIVSFEYGVCVTQVDDDIFEVRRFDE